MKSVDRKAFTLTELIATLASLLLLSGVAFAANPFSRIFGKSRVATCQRNLKCIASALSIYKTENRDRMPYFRVGKKKDTSKVSDPNKQSGQGKNPVQVEYNDKNEFAKLKEFYKKNEHINIQTWFYLLHNKLIEEKNFQCPSDKSYKKRKGKKGVSTLGFSSWSNVSYGLQTLTARNWHSRLGKSSRQEGSMVIAGDKPTLKKGQVTSDAAKKPNSNHGYKTMNMLTLASSVKKGKWSFRKHNINDKDKKCYNNFGSDEDDVYSFFSGTKAQSKANFKKNKSKAIRNAAAPNDTYLFYTTDK